MPRKRITQMFPWLLPLRVRQRLFCFYSGMLLDGNSYAAKKTEDLLPFKLFESSCPLYNHNTGFDMVYQENKVFNLKIAAEALDKVIIGPGETFSFWKLARHADRYIPYKDGLVVINGELTTAPGGGICQMSNLLFWLFLHAPLTVLERHGHEIKDFPEPPSDAPIGVDATVAEGWLDLKVKNETDTAFQISIEFDDENITGRLLTDRDIGYIYEAVNNKPLYYSINDKIFEEVDLVRKTISKTTGKCVSEKLLYRNKCEIGYPLPAETEIERMKAK